MLVAYNEAGKEKDRVLLRLNGAGTEKFINRRNEIVTLLSLHRAGLNPPLYLEFSNGICYGYIDGRPFGVDDMQVRSYA